MHKRFAQFATWASNAAGSPWAFSGAALIVLVWAITGPFFGFSQLWQLTINSGTTVITFLMVFLIQSSQDRDTRAIQAKLDELIRIHKAARNELIGIERKESE